MTGKTELLRKYLSHYHLVYHKFQGLAWYRTRTCELWDRQLTELPRNKYWTGNVVRCKYRGRSSKMARWYLQFVAQRHQKCAYSLVKASATNSGLRCAVWCNGVASRLAPSNNDSRWLPRRRLLARIVAVKTKVLIFFERKSLWFKSNFQTQLFDGKLSLAAWQTWPSELCKCS